MFSRMKKIRDCGFIIEELFRFESFIDGEKAPATFKSMPQLTVLHPSPRRVKMEEDARMQSCAPP